MKLNNILIDILIILIASYILNGLILFLRQRSIIYYPDKQDFESCPGFADYSKKNYNGTRFYYKQKSTDNVIVHYHGNAGSTCDRSYFKQILETTDSSIIFVEYAGYSNDTKKPSEKLILEDVRNIDNFIKENNFKNVTIYGQSIGSGAASYHTSLDNVSSLILVAPFSGLYDIAKSIYKIYPVSILLKEKYDNIKWLENYKGKLLVIHGDKDEIIQPKFSQKLFDEVTTEKKEYFLIKDKGHNDLWTSREFNNKIIEFIKQ
jgi:esterase/lipase